MHLYAERTRQQGRGRQRIKCPGTAPARIDHAEANNLHSSRDARKQREGVKVERVQLKDSLEGQPTTLVTELAEFALVVGATNVLLGKFRSKWSVTLRSEHYRCMLEVQDCHNEVLVRLRGHDSQMVRVGCVSTSDLLQARFWIEQFCDGDMEIAEC